MNLNLSGGVTRAACLLGVGCIAVFGLVGCADTYTTAPVYRGSYYAYDAYPYGYRGYPAYPYYGAPFGNSASMVRTERSSYLERRGDEDGVRRTHRRHGSSRRHRAGSSHVTRSIEANSREEQR